MSEVICLFQNMALKGQESDLLNLFNEFEKENEGKENKKYNKIEQIEKYFRIKQPNLIKNIVCSIRVKKENANNYYYITLFYLFNEKQNLRYFTITKYEFNIEKKIYFCFEQNFLQEYLEKEYNKKRFYVKIFTSNGHIMKSKDFQNIFNYSYNNFEIIYNYNYKKVTLDFLTRSNSFNNKEILNAEELNYELSNYVEIEEEDYKSFFYIDTDNRKKFIDTLCTESRYKKRFALCGPFGCGKTITLLKFINDSERRSFYINLWTVNYLGIEELKKVLTYEYIKIINKDFKKENEDDEIIAHINKIDSPNKIYNFIKQMIESLKKDKKTPYFLIIDQYSSKYDKNNEQIKEILEKNNYSSNVILIICSSMNNYDVKTNFCHSFSDSNLDIKLINYKYVGCLIKLDPSKEPLKNESFEFKKILSLFGNIPIYYYKLKEAFRNKLKREEFLRNEEDHIRIEISKFFNDDQNSMKIELANILCCVKEKKLFLSNEFVDKLLKFPLKFLEIKRQFIKVNKLLEFLKDDFVTRNKVLSYIEENEFNNIENQANLIAGLMNYEIFDIQLSEDFYEKGPIKRKNSDEEEEKYINIYFVNFLFPYIEDIFSKMIYNDNLNFTHSFFSKLPEQTQGGIIEYYLIEYIKQEHMFYNIDISQFEIVETFVPNRFFIQNYVSYKNDTIYKFDEFKDKYTYNKIKILEQNVLLKQKQFTGKYYDFAILIYSNEKKGFDLILFQVSKKKISTQRLFKEEHEIVMNRVKENLEAEFDIKILGGYFCYIFSNYSNDETTLKFCKKYNIPYINFSFIHMKFDENIPLNLENCLITETFPFHNYFSLLPKEYFNFEDNIDNNNYDEIKKYKDIFTFIPINRNKQKTLSSYFKVKINKKKNEFAIFGFFDKKENFSEKFCIWYNTKNKKIFYYENESFGLKLNFSKINKDKKEWILICSKYQYVFEENNKEKKDEEKKDEDENESEEEE